MLINGQILKKWILGALRSLNFKKDYKNHKILSLPSEYIDNVF